MSDMLREFIRRHPNVSVEELAARFDTSDLWELRTARREVLRELASEQSGGRLDMETATDLSTLSAQAKAALRAGFFRPVQISWQPSVVTAYPVPPYATTGYTIVQLPDIHAPEHDPDALDVALQIVHAANADAIVLSGDQFDVNSLSKYVPVASRPMRWVEERAEAIKPFIELRATFPDTPIYWLHGNHDVRPETFMAAQAPALQGLFTLPQLLGIEDLDFIYPEENRLVLAAGQLIIKHGTVVAGEAAMSAAKEVRKAGTSVSMGHVHRLGLYSVSRTAQRINNEQPLVGIEAGCLQTLRPSYLAPEDTANWQQGIVVFTIHDDNTWAPELVPIFNGTAYFRGQKFTTRRDVTL